MADWSILPTELIHFISQRLPTSTDLLRFRSVCSTWRAAVQPLPSSRFSVLPNFPISETSSRAISQTSSWWGFQLSKRTIYSLQSPNHDSSWILKLERDNPTRMHLIYPIARSIFNPLPEHFPKLFNLLDFRVKELGVEYNLQSVNYRPKASSIGEAGTIYKEKVAVSISNNNNENCFVLLTVHVSGKLVVLKSGDEKWKVINNLPSPFCPYDDVIFRGGEFYAVDDTGRLVIVDIVNLNENVAANSIFGGDKKFLVDSDNELLLVDMYLSNGPEEDLGCNEELEVYEEDCFMSERTVKFKVFRLDEDVGKWVDVRDLGDRVLFLGEECVFSASALEIFGDGEGSCKGNCIIFTDHSCDKEDNGVWEGRGVGVFDLESGSIRPINSHVGYSKMFWPPPDWIYSSDQSLDVTAGMSRLSF